MIKIDRRTPEMGELFRKIRMTNAEVGKRFFMARCALLVAQSRNISVAAFMFGMAHGTFRLPNFFARRKDCVMRRRRRTAEGMATDARFSQVVSAKCRGEPSYGLGAVPRVAGFASLLAREFGVLVREFPRVERTDAKGLRKKIGFTGEMRERRQCRHDKSQHDYRNTPAVPPHCPAWHAGRLCAAACAIRVRPIFTRPTSHLGTAAFPTPAVVVGRTFRNAPASSIVVRAMPAGRSPFRAPPTHGSIVRSFIGATIEIETVAIHHSKYTLTTRKCQKESAIKAAVSRI